MRCVHGSEHRDGPGGPSTASSPCAQDPQRGSCGQAGLRGLDTEGQGPRGGWPRTWVRGCPEWGLSSSRLRCDVEGEIGGSLVIAVNGCFQEKIMVFL
jgi:hypothetical protein